MNRIYKKRVITFRVFDERHTTHNIYRMIKVVLKEYSLINKILAISFNNASANITSISTTTTITTRPFVPNIWGRLHEPKG